METNKFIICISVLEMTLFHAAEGYLHMRLKAETLPVKLRGNDRTGGCEELRGVLLLPFTIR